MMSQILRKHKYLISRSQLAGRGSEGWRKLISKVIAGDLKD